jgi:succinate dehydrogenase / fumarate reductase membrane anchor subunit
MKSPVSALGAWSMQRVSAVYMLCFIVLSLAYIVVNPPDSYAAWRAWIMSRGMSVATGTFFAALLVHAWIGLRDVVIDYVHPAAIRVGLLVFLAFGLTAIAAWVARILWM